MAGVLVASISATRAALKKNDPATPHLQCEPHCLLRLMTSRRKEEEHLAVECSHLGLGSAFSSGFCIYSKICAVAGCFRRKRRQTGKKMAGLCSPTTASWTGPSFYFWGSPLLVRLPRASGALEVTSGPWSADGAGASTPALPEPV